MHIETIGDGVEVPGHRVYGVCSDLKALGIAETRGPTVRYYTPHWVVERVATGNVMDQMIAHRADGAELSEHSFQIAVPVLGHIGVMRDAPYEVHHAFRPSAGEERSRNWRAEAGVSNEYLVKLGLSIGESDDETPKRALEVLILLVCGERLLDRLPKRLIRRLGLHGGFLRVNPPIGETLAADALKRSGSTVGVVEAERLARVPAEVELSRVALKVLLADAVEGAIEPALEDRKAGLDRVGRHVAARVFLDRVVHDFMRREVRAKLLVHAGLIGHQASLLGDLSTQDRAKCLVVHGGKVVRTLLAIALHKRDDLHLVVKAARALRVLADIAPVGFVNLNRRTVAAKLAGRLDVHRLADAVRHEPRRLVRDAQHALKLLGADPLLGRAHQVCGVHPLVKGHLGALKDGADSHGELFAAVTTEQKAGTVARAIQAAVAIRAAAVRAYRAIGPADRFKMLARRVVVVESRFGVDCGFHSVFSLE